MVCPFRAGEKAKRRSGQARTLRRDRAFRCARAAFIPHFAPDPISTPSWFACWHAWDPRIAGGTPINTHTVLHFGRCPPQLLVPYRHWHAAPSNVCLSLRSEGQASPSPGTVNFKLGLLGGFYTLPEKHSHAQAVVQTPTPQQCSFPVPVLCSPGFWILMLSRALQRSAKPTPTSVHVPTHRGRRPCAAALRRRRHSTPLPPL